jgi:hypothetical protein
MRIPALTIRFRISSINPQHHDGIGQNAFTVFAIDKAFLKQRFFGRDGGGRRSQFVSADDFRRRKTTVDAASYRF